MKKFLLIIIMATILLVISIKYVEPVGNFARDNIPSKFLELIGEKPSLLGYFNNLKRKASKLLDD